MFTQFIIGTIIYIVRMREGALTGSKPEGSKARPPKREA